MSTSATALSWNLVGTLPVTIEPVASNPVLATNFGTLTGVAIAGGVLSPSSAYNPATSRYEVQAAASASPGVIATLYRGDVSFAAPLCAASCTLGPAPGDTASAIALQQGCGIAASSSAGGLSAGDGFFGIYDWKSGNVTLLIIISGVLAHSASVAASGVTDIAVQIALGQGNIYYKTAAGSWVLAHTITLTTYFDPRVSATLAVLRPALLAVYIGVTSSANRLSWTAMQSGYAGQYGLREIQPITYEDGTPYIKDDWLYLTADHSLPNPGVTQIQSCYWAIHRLSLPDLRRGILTLQQTAILASSRSGTVTVDQDGMVYYDRPNSRWVCIIPGWSGYVIGVDSTVSLHVGTTTADITTGVNVVAVSPITVPGQTTNDLVYDPFVRVIGGVIYLAYSINRGGVFGGYLASGTSYGSLSAIGHTAIDGFREGTKLWSVNSTVYMAVGNKTAALPYEVYTITDVSSVGTLQVAQFNVGNWAPHPSLVALPLGPIRPGLQAGTTYILTEFTDVIADPTNAPSCVGQVLIHQSTQTNPTNEYAWVDPGQSGGVGGSTRNFIGY